jgi:hypothetical protein
MSTRAGRQAARKVVTAYHDRTSDHVSAQIRRTKPTGKQPSDRGLARTGLAGQDNEHVAEA